MAKPRPTIMRMRCAHHAVETTTVASSGEGIKGQAPYPAATFASRKKSAGIGRRSRQVMPIGRSPRCDT